MKLQYFVFVFCWLLSQAVQAQDLDAATKNTHSHRALAAQQMVALMRTAWHLG